MKVAIIGGGVCGLYLAQKLAQAGNETEVFEQKNFIGKTCCSGLFSDRLFDFIPESRELVENKINRCLIHFPKKKVEVKFRRNFFVINHARLDQLIAGLARRTTAKIRLGKKITGTAAIDLSNDYDRVIASDGALSETRTLLGLKKPELYLGIQGFVEKDDDADFVETWALKDGFIWKIPRGKNQEYGVMATPGLAAKVFEGFLEERSLSVTDLKSALIPQGFALPNNEKITLCGDASGLTKPWSGGGVVWGLTQAGFLLKNFPDFLKYRKEALRFFIPEIAVASLAKKTVYGLGFNLPDFLPKNSVIDGDFILR